MDVENKFMDTKVGVWEELGDWDWHIYTTMYKINNESLLYSTGNSM